MLEISWSYTPADFFEDDLNLAILNGDLVISRGAVTFTTHESVGVRRSAVASVTDHVRAVLNARLALTGRQYTLSEAQFVEIDESGKRHYTLCADTGKFVVTGKDVDFLVTDKDGAVIRDTRAERNRSDADYIARMSVAVGKSPTLRRMLSSYAKSYDDSENAFIHLYEIRDAAAEHFSGEANARTVLGISKAQ